MTSENEHVVKLKRSNQTIPAGKEKESARKVQTDWITLECPVCGDVEEYPRSKNLEAPRCYQCGEYLDPTSFISERTETLTIGSVKKADALYPNLVAPEDFRPGDVVRKIFGDFRVTEYLGIILAVHPTTNTVDVKWPYGIGFENPQDLVRVNPWYEPPSVVVNSDGYYTTWDAERWNTPTPNNPTKGISGKSPVFCNSTDFKPLNASDASLTATSSSAENVITTSLDLENLNAQIAPIKIAQRFVKRAFNVLLRSASVPYNERFNQVDTYNFLYKKFSKIYSEPTIRSVVSYLYCQPHNYYMEDFDYFLRGLIVSAQNKDKKQLKKSFQEVIDLTEGKKDAKINDLLDAAIEAPYAQAIYKTLKEAVRRSKGNLDLLPTPAARFASTKKVNLSKEVEKLANSFEKLAQDEGLSEYLITFETPDQRAEFTYDDQFRSFSKQFNVKFRGKSSLALYGVPAKLEDKLNNLVEQYQGEIEWKHEAEVPEEAGL